LYDWLDDIRDADGEIFGASVYWAKAITFAEGQMRIIASPIPVVTRDAIERIETKERLRRDFLSGLWDEMDEETQEVLVNTEIEWVHNRPHNMVNEIRPMLELVLPSIFPFLQPTVGQKGDRRLILTRMKDELLQNILKEFKKDNKNIAAICAAPYALHKADVLNQNYTCYPGFETKIKESGYTQDENIVIDGKILTSRGPATAMAFALEIVKILKGKEEMEIVKEGILANNC